MTVYEAAMRRGVIAEAESWLGTPFHHQGRVKGPEGGVDCAMLLFEVFKAAFGSTDHWPLTPDHFAYSPQWHLHHSEEKYLQMIADLGGREIPGPPQPGDLAVWKIGRTYSHGAIVAAWPEIIHAAAAPIRACVRDHAKMSLLHLQRYLVKFFTAFCRQGEPV